MEGSSDSIIAKHNPYVFVVGTHKDCLMKELGEVEASKRIDEIDQKIKLLVEEHKYGDLVIYANKNNDKVLFPVDNTCENDMFQKIRGGIMELLHSREEFRSQFPLSYLLASLHLQDSSKPFIKRSEFAQDVLQYGIKEEDVDHLLQFLHARIGQIRHFPQGEIRDVIVKEPQALYNLVTLLITKSFISQSVTMSEYSEIQRGIYSLESFNVDEFSAQSEFLTPKQVINLLKELRIVAPFYDRAAEREKYFIPCVLNHLEEAEVDGTCKMSMIQSLAIMFDCGRCPKGMFGVLLHYILTHENRLLAWNLSIDKIFRNQVSFGVGPYEDLVGIKFLSTHLEVTFFPVDIASRRKTFSAKKICNMVRQTLLSGIEQATKSLHYSHEKTKRSLGLVCTDCNMSHKVLKLDSQFMMKCPLHGLLPIPDPGSFWFGSPPCLTLPELVGKSAIVSLKEDSHYRIEFIIKSDPSLELQSEPHLSKEGGPVKETRVFLDGKNVVFQNVRPSDAGMYTLSSTNAAGKSSFSFELQIKFPPKYTLDPDYLKVPVGSSPCVSFTVASDPPVSENVSHTLTRRGGEVVRKFKAAGYCITFEDVALSDSGVYSISCCNEDGMEGHGMIELEITPATQGPTSSQFDHPSQSGYVVKSEDVVLLITHLNKFAYKWRDIGLALKFQHGELENISYSFPRATTQRLLTELLNQWCQWPIQDHTDVPTMEKLCDALRSRLVGLGAEANALYELRCQLSSQADRTLSQDIQVEESKTKCVIA